MSTRHDQEIGGTYRRSATPLPAANRQRGAVLVVSLVFLVIMTLLGVSAMRSTILEERMAGNLRDNRLAFEAAEAGLREAEGALKNLSESDFSGSSDGLYDYEHAEAPAWHEENAFDDSITYGDYGAEEIIVSYEEGGTGKNINEGFEQPRYFIERQRPVPGAGSSLETNQPITGDEMYRITVQGTGGSSRAMVVLQSTYLR